MPDHNLALFFRFKTDRYIQRVVETVGISYPVFDGLPSRTADYLVTSRSDTMNVK